MQTDAWKFLVDVVEQLFVLIIVGVLRLLGIDVFGKFQKFTRSVALCSRLVFRERVALLSTDCDEEVAITKKLAAALTRKLRDEGARVRVVPISSSESILRWPLSLKAITAIAILYTDVTRLSTDPKRRDQIQRRLVRFCHKGGTLILGHDLIYRRVQNTRLQKLAGCRLTKFESMPQGVKYVKLEDGSRMTSHTKLLDNLPSSFLFYDHEVLSGTWADDTEFLYVLEGDSKRPLVTRRTSGAGCVFWLNTGDQNEDGPPRPIAQPAPELTTLLARFITDGLEY